jgi:hypothetical protein
MLPTRARANSGSWRWSLAASTRTRTGELKSNEDIFIQGVDGFGIGMRCRILNHKMMDLQDSKCFAD